MNSHLVFLNINLFILLKMIQIWYKHKLIIFFFFLHYLFFKFNFILSKKKKKYRKVFFYLNFND